MRLLAIDCATEACSVALFEGKALLAGDFRLLGRGHAEALVPMIAGLPAQGKADRIAVSLGPGSFTGLRVGLAAARALGLAWGACVSGYPTLSLVAAMARQRGGAGAISVAMTAGHGEWFIADYDASGRALDAPASLAPDQAATKARADRVAGSQAQALVELRGWGTALSLHPDARELLLLDPADYAIEPHLIYGRAPDARLPDAKA